MHDQGKYDDVNDNLADADDGEAGVGMKQEIIIQVVDVGGEICATAQDGGGGQESDTFLDAVFTSCQPDKEPGEANICKRGEKV